MQLLGRIALRALTVFLILVGIVGGIAGTILGVGYMMFLIDKYFHWGGVGIAIMTLLIVFAAISILVAVTDESYPTED